MKSEGSLKQIMDGWADKSAQIAKMPKSDQKSAFLAHIGEIIKFSSSPTLPTNDPNLEEATKILAHRGWYVDSELPFDIAKPIIESVTNNAESSIDSYFVKHFSQRIDKIQENLCSNYPSRAKALNEAFAAHRAAQYFLSIPVFLAQADGICAEELGGNLFYKQDEVAKYLKGLHLDDWLDVFLNVLQVPYEGIRSRKRNRTNFPNSLNRHEILHGSDLDYGTDINGWKVISLIGYVGLFAPSILP